VITQEGLLGNVIISGLLSTLLTDKAARDMVKYKLRFRSNRISGDHLKKLARIEGDNPRKTAHGQIDPQNLPGLLGSGKIYCGIQDILHDCQFMHGISSFL